MGVITIVTQGSFGQKDARFSAMKHGHAHAVNEAIEWLTRLMAESIDKDHKLRDEDASPENGFIKEG